MYPKNFSLRSSSSGNDIHDDSTEVKKSTTRQNQFREFITSFPEKDGMVYLSDERFFQHNEDDYDTQYDNSKQSDDLGIGVIKLLRASGCTFGKPAIEVGCGTGIVSRGLLSRKRFKLVVVSDPSPKFVSISKRKLSDLPDLDHRACFAIFRAEDLNKVPSESLSAIVMRSVLHHILDIEKFLTDAVNSLTSGGCLVVEEPCMEGYVMMGAIAQFIPVVMKSLSQDLDEEQSRQVQLFVDTMKFYSDQTLDKSTCEDKHVFRVDELMKQAETLGMTLSFYPNLSFASFKSVKTAEELDALRKTPSSFSQFFISYVKYCMQFSNELVDKLQAHFVPYLSMLDELSAKGNSPYTTGVFVFKKR